MFDPRIYRAAFLPTLAAIVALMFSLEPAPRPLEQPISMPTFDGTAAARTARAIPSLAPAPEPGSPGDAALADLVRERFRAIDGGEVSIQDVDSSYRGDDVTLSNVILTLPGDSQEAILVIAQRDASSGTGAATSAASTAALLTMADELGGSRHNRTIVLASTDGGSDGATGARDLVDQLASAGGVSVGIVISQAGVGAAVQPLVIAGRTGPESAAPGLVETARSIVASQFGQKTSSPGPWQDLAGLAVPVTLGEQSALADEGVESLAIDPGGERGIDPGRSDAATVDSETLRATGAAALDLVLTLDEAAKLPAAEPQSYLRLGDNLIPGWTLAALALALILPALLAAGDTWLREFRRDHRTRRSAPWALERILVPAAALVLAYGLSLIGLLPDPRFPYDPGRFPAGIEAPIAFVVLAGALVLAGLLIRPMRTPLDSEPHALAAAAGLLGCVSLIGIWLLNPFLALLLVPTAHVWLLPARAAGPPRPGVIATVAALSLLPVLAAAATVAARLDLGLEAPWHLLLLVVGGQIPIGVSLLWCGVLGGLLAAVTAAAARPLLPIAETAASVRGAGSHAGPGALGGTPSALPRR